MSMSTVATKSLISFSEFAKIGFHIGVISTACEFPAKAKLRVPAYQVTVDFGNNKQMRSSAQLPSNYPVIGELFQKSVVCVTNMPPRKIAGFSSEILIVGFPDDNGHVHLLNTRGRDVTKGLCLRFNAEAEEQPIVYEDFAKADIRSATIKELTKLSGDDTAYHAILDVGTLGERVTTLVDINEDIAKELAGTQVPVIVNLKKECIHDLDTFALTFMSDKYAIPLGIDKPVVNGVELF